jgi:serine/threonine protein kinase
MPILTDDEREGTTLADGKYALQRVIGCGGMATVFEGLHTWTGRKVAIKVLNAAISADAELGKKYLQEARAATALDHPNVVEVLDMGREESDGTVYIVFELLRGESLRDRLDRIGKLTTLEIATLLVPILDALVVAHQRGIVHRDLKPDNIFLQEDGRGGFRPKLLDFGIAKMNEAGLDKQTGPVSGTVEYLSPERAQGLPTGPATDVWSMGVVLYECLTGHLPFERESITATLLAIVQAEPPSLRNVASIPDATAELVERCLAKEVSARFPDASFLREALIRTVGAALSPVTLPSIPPPAYTATTSMPPSGAVRLSEPPARKKRRAGLYLFAALLALLLVFGALRVGAPGANESQSVARPQEPATPSAPRAAVPQIPAAVPDTVTVALPEPTESEESALVARRAGASREPARAVSEPTAMPSARSTRTSASASPRPQRGANGSLILD